MKKTLSLTLACALLLTACGGSGTASSSAPAVSAPAATVKNTQITLSDSGITVDGAAISTDDSAAVYAAHDIVYYEAGHDFTYGAGTAEDEHDAAEAAAHTVVHIAEPGVYTLSGTLSTGQIAVDLGEEAEDDPNARVTLVLDGVDITCTVAPAVIFYNVYECGDKDDPKAEVDTTDAGAKVWLTDSVNNINGSYVARIYKSYELNEDGTEVVDSKKLHKYDAAFYSKMSMSISGTDSGTLNIDAENEGLDSELHLTINSGTINIESGNDGINTNEDGVSVTTINGGNLNIVVTGETGEGDGIDSNGWLIINGGTVTTAACSISMDAGIDSDMGIHINGGTVCTSGGMLDRIEDGGQTHIVFTFTTRQSGGTTYTLKDSKGTVVGEWAPVNDFTNLVVSSDALTEGSYTLWQGAQQLSVSAGSQGGGFGGMTPPADFAPGAVPEGFDPNHMPQGGFNGGNFTMPEGFDPNQMPQGSQMPEMPGGMQPPQGMGGGMGGAMDPTDFSAEFTLVPGANYFNVQTQ